MPAQIAGFTTTPRRSSPSTFSMDMDTRLSEEAQFVNDANALCVEVNALADDVSTLTAQAGAYAASASAAAASASAAVGAPQWVSGTTYATGNCVWSPTNGLSYRRKTNGAGTTDPATDPANWAPLIVRPLWTVITSDPNTANVDAGYFLDSSAAAFNFTLPASPNVNDTVDVADLGSASSRNITVIGNGHNIMGAATFPIDTDNFSARIKYSGTAFGWRVI